MKCFTLLLLFVVACAPPSDTPQTPAPAPSTAAAEPPATVPEPSYPAPQPSYPAPAPPPAQSRRNITIESVTVANPVVIAGRARTFESNVVLRVRNARGTVIAEDFTTATGEMGQHSPYRGEVWLTDDPGSRITAEALEYSAKDGSEQSVVNVAYAFDVELAEVTLHFPDSNCDRVVAVTRRVPKSVGLARLLVEALLRGPNAAEKAKGLATAFPQGSDVRSVILRDGVLTVDFNERLQNVGGACYARMIRESVNATLGRLPSVRKVVITAGGSEKLALQP